MSYVYFFSFLLLTSSGAGLLSSGSYHKINSLPATAETNQKQDTVQQATVKDKKKKKKTAMKSDPKAAEIVMRRNVQRVSLTKKREGGSNIEIVVMNSGLPIGNIVGLQLVGSSGSTVASNNYQAFENVTLPFEGYIKFRSANSFNTAQYEREVRFNLNESGSWVLRIDI